MSRRRDVPRATAGERPPGKGFGRRGFLTALPVAGAGTALLGGCVSRAGAVTDVDRILSVSLGQAEDHPSYGALLDFGERLAGATDNRWGVRVYANNSLGDQQETVQLVSDGAIDMAVISGTQIENSSPRFLPMNVPGVFDDMDHQNRVMLDDSIVGELFTSLEPDMRLTVLGGFTQGSRHLYTAPGPIESPDDLSGLKIRVQESKIFLDLINAMGGVPTPMAYSEVYTGLQAGVLDGAENNEISYVTQRHYEVATHYTLTNHLIGFDFFLANTDLLEEMGPEDSRALRETFTETQNAFVEIWRQETEKATEQMRERGVEIHEPDPAAFAPIIEETGYAILQDEADIAMYEAIRAASEEAP
ncbi:TRAP transporter substrate-binding protein [Brachybacterium sp. GCM10030267]|uniref:TRAP transporter substrate-binding protein n=1 Tax=Brachybacterium sp. GCM10030267 TaxID=3273381 RepID=UPI00361CAD04